MNLGWKLINGEERHGENPSSFEIAPRAEREGLPVGSVVKIGVENRELRGPAPNGERFWVRIETIMPMGYYQGGIENDLVVDGHGLDRGMKVVFGPEHILQTSPPPPGAKPPSHNERTKEFLKGLKAKLN